MEGGGARASPAAVQLAWFSKHNKPALPLSYKPAGGLMNMWFLDAT